MNLKIYTDGGARGNPGPAAIGVVLKNESGETIKELGRYIGEGTNNDAEYQALIAGIKAAAEKNATEIDCFVDSELIARQLNGEYKVKNERLRNYWYQVKKLSEKFEKVQYIHVKRDKNFEADALVNQVLDSLNNG